jgi:hypothetical protein
MNRILALQGLTGSPLGGPLALGDSNQSNQCSSSTSGCSTQSAGCKPANLYAVAW